MCLSQCLLLLSVSLAFVMRDNYEMLKQKYYSRDAPIPRQNTILTHHGVRWASLDLIPGWRPSRQTALDFMHCIFLGTPSLYHHIYSHQ